MTAREKVMQAERRLRACLSGISDSIRCPFCGLLNTPDQGALCCELLADVSNAVIDHVELKSNLELIERVGDRLAKMQPTGMVSLN